MKPKRMSRDFFIFLDPENVPISVDRDSSSQSSNSRE
jgi:hypothetical protein